MANGLRIRRVRVTHLPKSSRHEVYVNASAVQKRDEVRYAWQGEEGSDIGTGDGRGGVDGGGKVSRETGKGGDASR